MFHKKGVLRSFAKFTRKHLCQSLSFDKVAGLRPATLLKKKLLHEACNFTKKENLALVFSCEFCKISENTFSYKIPLVAASNNLNAAFQTKKPAKTINSIWRSGFPWRVLRSLLVQCHFIASKLNAGCGGYLDKVYKILVDILDLKAVFYLRIFSYEATFFVRKQWKVGFDPTFFTSKKVANQWEFSKKSLCAKKVASEKLAYLMWILLKADFHLHVEYYVTWRSYSNDMIG